MAAGDVNVQHVTISSGAITLTGSPTGSGIYYVSNEAGAATDALTSILGGSGNAMIDLLAETLDEIWTLADDNTTILLKEELSFTPESLFDFITLRSNADGSVWSEFNRGRRVPAS